MALFNRAFPRKVDTASQMLSLEQPHNLHARCNGALAQSFEKIHPWLPHFAGDLIKKGRGIEWHK